MKNIFLITTIIFSAVKMSFGYTEKEVVLFNDSISNQFKLMSFQLDETQKEVDLKFTSKQGKNTYKDFSDVYSFKAYLNSDAPTSLEFRFYSQGNLSKKMVIELQKGKGYKEIVLPFIQNSDGASFDISKVDGLQIKVLNSSSSFLLDEISFNYHEPEVIEVGPDKEQLKEALNEEKENYKKRKKREGSSEFLRRQKEYESR